MTTFLDLPVDVILLIFAHLDARSFLRLTSTCQALHAQDYVHDAAFWLRLVRRDFRMPNQPVVQHDGRRWHKLYKRMLTQSRIFTWGNNDGGCLGRTRNQSTSPASHNRWSSWPREIEYCTDELRVISDLQCGGWSTTLLTANGTLYTAGIIDASQGWGRINNGTEVAFSRLRFPRSGSDQRDRHEPRTAVKQFSAGRTHVLALSDSGRIWSWYSVDVPATRVMFVHHETHEYSKEGAQGCVKKVVAGWSKSAALIRGSGIVVWDVIDHNDNGDSDIDTTLVLESAVVPNTSFDSSQSRSMKDTTGLGLAQEQVGEVLNFIVLESTVIFNTSSGNAFAAQMEWSSTSPPVIRDPVQLPLSGVAESDDLTVTDVQGSHVSFAVFTSNGLVLTSKENLVQRFIQGEIDSGSLFTQIPALQKGNVISLAFGDHHFHALHSQGYITSYGVESNSCGSLGLGGDGTPEARLRGLRTEGHSRNCELVEHAYEEGRRVWFEEAKRKWIKYLTSGGSDPSEAATRVRLSLGFPDRVAQGEVSEWIEQEGRDWLEKYGLSDQDDDGLGAYFAMNVAAAGWHSAALVLVNDELVDKLNAACQLPDRMPLRDVEGAPSAARPPKPAIESDANNSTPATSSAAPSTLFGRAVDAGRQFLGLPGQDFNAAPPLHPFGRGHMPRVIPIRGRRPVAPLPQNYGASPGEGLIYAWAGDHFPRLELSDGRLMQGIVQVDRWRYGRPEWFSKFTR